MSQVAFTIVVGRDAKVIAGLKRMHREIVAQVGTE